MRHAAARIAAGLGLLALLLLTGCGTEGPRGPQLQPRAGLSWQAAIGQVATSTADVHCSGVLVARDIVVTASHCLFLNTAKRPASPSDLVFRPNLGGLQALPPSRGVAFLGQGAVLRGGKLRNEDVSKDWVVLQISPPVTAVQPITVANLTIDGMLHMIDSGNRLVTAGYGSGPYDELRVHEKCRLLSQQELGLFPDDSWLQLDCVFRVGDSGGGIILLDGANQPALIGIIAGFGHMPRNKTEPLGLGVNASQFLPYLRQPVSQAPTPTPRLAALLTN
ncbi:trypsin-like peptidase domain-containing protein [Dongia sp. agr-C8]